VKVAQVVAGRYYSNRQGQIRKVTGISNGIATYECISSGKHTSGHTMVPPPGSIRKVAVGSVASWATHDVTTDYAQEAVEELIDPAEVRKTYRRITDSLCGIAAGIGYVMASHGSTMARDIGVVAVPWEPWAHPPAILVRTLCEACEGELLGDHVDNVHGRKSFAIALKNKVILQLSVIAPQ
jgi:hypothetical protein